MFSALPYREGFNFFPLRHLSKIRRLLGREARERYCAHSVPNVLLRLQPTNPNPNLHKPKAELENEDNEKLLLGTVFNTILVPTLAVALGQYNTYSP
jgi:hypothetical protein